MSARARKKNIAEQEAFDEINREIAVDFDHVNALIDSALEVTENGYNGADAIHCCVQANHLVEMMDEKVSALRRLITRHRCLAEMAPLCLIRDSRDE